MPIVSLEEIKGRIGKEVGVSSWLLVDQARIDKFADATEDRQFLHVDPELAKQTPFGGTIAHGLLTLSLLPILGVEVLPLPQGLRMAVNYGFGAVRFLSPVRSGKRVRARFSLLDHVERKPGQWLQTVAATMEIEGEEKPALTAEWSNLFLV